MLKAWAESLGYNVTKKRVKSKKTPKHSEVAIYEAQKAEDARADAAGEKPRLISTMADIPDPYLEGIMNRK